MDPLRRQSTLWANACDTLGECVNFETIRIDSASGLRQLTRTSRVSSIQSHLYLFVPVAPNRSFPLLLQKPFPQLRSGVCLFPSVVSDAWILGIFRITACFSHACNHCQASVSISPDFFGTVFLGTTNSAWHRGHLPALPRCCSLTRIRQPLGQVMRKVSFSRSAFRAC